MDVYSTVQPVWNTVRGPWELVHHKAIKFQGGSTLDKKMMILTEWWKPENPVCCVSELEHLQNIILCELQLSLVLVLNLTLFLWMEQEQTVCSGPVLCRPPPLGACPGSRPELNRSLRVGVLTQRRNWALDCTPLMHWPGCGHGCVSFCVACQSSWSYVWRRRRSGPKTRASCSCLRWSAPQSPPGGQRRSPTSWNHPEHPDDSRTRCPLLARDLLRCDLLAFVSFDAPTACSEPVVRSRGADLGHWSWLRQGF